MHFNDLVAQLLTFISLAKANFFPASLIIGFIWFVQIINAVLSYGLNVFGIYPRRMWGLRGIIFAPVLHSGFDHLFFNTIPLLILIDFVLFAGVTQFLCITLIIMVLGGFLIWLLGRNGMHVGASYLVMGYWGYLLINAYQHPSVLSIVLALVCLYYFGGLLLGLFPTEEKVSWEGHLFGFVAGIAAVYFCPIVMAWINTNRFTL